MPCAGRYSASTGAREPQGLVPGVGAQYVITSSVKGRASAVLTDLVTGGEGGGQACVVQYSVAPRGQKLNELDLWFIIPVGGVSNVYSSGRRGDISRVRYGVPQYMGGKRTRGLGQRRSVSDIYGSGRGGSISRVPCSFP